MAAFLRCHPEFIESWVMEEVQLEQLERWIIRRTQKEKKKTGSTKCFGIQFINFIIWGYNYLICTLHVMGKLY